MSKLSDHYTFQKSATCGLVALMKLFPDSVYFFLNCWTWGYEDILKEIAIAFQSRVRELTM